MCMAIWYSLSSWPEHVFVYEGLYIEIWYCTDSTAESIMGLSPCDIGWKSRRLTPKVATIVKYGIRELTYLCPYTMVISLDYLPWIKPRQITFTNLIQLFRKTHGEYSPSYNPSWLAVKTLTGLLRWAVLTGSSQLAKIRLNKNTFFTIFTSPYVSHLLI